MTLASGASILVVDDRPTNRAVLKAVLRPPLYRVTEASGGKKALELVAAHRFDLIILDLLMPDLNGLEVLKSIRRTHSASELPVIMVTVKDEGSGVVEALESGANDYISRPIDFPVLFARIQAQLARKRMEDALRDAQEDLERRIEARTAELINTNRALKAEISERKRIESALRASEERFRDFAQTGADWFWETGPDLRFTYLAGRYLEALGLEHHEVLGRTREEEHVSCGIFALNTVDTTGAGDVYHAGYLYGALNGWSLRRRLAVEGFQMLDRRSRPREAELPCDLPESRRVTQAYMMFPEIIQYLLLAMG